MARCSMAFLQSLEEAAALASTSLASPPDRHSDIFPYAGSVLQSYFVRQIF